MELRKQELCVRPALDTKNPQMFRRTSMSPPSTATRNNKESSSPVSMAHLPDDLLFNCLARVSRSYYPTLSLVSKRFRSLLASTTDLYETRRLLGSTESCLYVCLMSPCSSKPRWFTLTQRPTRNPKPNSRWLNSCFSPSIILKNHTMTTRKNLMVLLSSSHDDFSPPSGCTPTTMGYNVYMIGGYINGEPSSRVFFMDCRTHTWHEAPSMRVARKHPFVSVLDGKIYVVERSQDCDPSEFMEFFDPKTGIWEKAPSPGGEIRRSWTYISGSFALEGNLHVVGDKLHKSVVYKPKENKWDTVGFRKCLGSGSKSSCVIDNVTYCYTHEPSRKIEIKWYSRERSSGRALKGLETLPKLPKEYDDCVRLENYGGKLAVFWEENVVGSFGSTKKKKKKKKMIWCAVIAIERRNNVHEVFGKVEWCDVVLRVPKSCYLDHLILTTV